MMTQSTTELPPAGYLADGTLHCHTLFPLRSLFRFFLLPTKSHMAASLRINDNHLKCEENEKIERSS